MGVTRLPTSKAPPVTSPEDRFVEQYLIDRNPIAAALRAGVAAIAVEKTTARWMRDPSVLQKIQERTDSIDVDKMITPQRIIAGWMDVAFDQTAPAAARNAALREMALIMKMYPKATEEDKNKKYARNVMLVPGAVALDDWAAAAMEQQRKLKEEVRD